MLQVDVKPKLLRWARKRAGLDLTELSTRLPKLPDWEAGDGKPTLNQLERFAKAVHAPLGYLLLPEPPEERIPIPDFRTVANRTIASPSPDLLETIYICQQRQEWYRDYARSMGEESLPFVGGANLSDDAISVAANIRRILGFDVGERRRIRTWEEALRQFVDQADELGVLIMINGVVGSNNRRKLDPDEFGGFALCDDLAPLIFINGSDSKSAQMFTLAHELAHVWLGESGLSDIEPEEAPSNSIEVWCNRVAAELLVPLMSLQDEYRDGNALTEEMFRLAKCFKVSTLVILHRLREAQLIKQDEFWTAYSVELDRLQSITRGSGGDFYRTQSARVGKRFASALISNTLEGQTLHRDAFRLLGFSKLSTFRKLGLSLGVIDALPS